MGDHASAIRTDVLACGVDSVTDGGARLDSCTGSFADSKSVSRFFNIQMGDAKVIFGKVHLGVRFIIYEQRSSPNLPVKERSAGILSHSFTQPPPPFPLS
jgi:hypothetical protein